MSENNFSIKKTANILLDKIFPPKCIFCGEIIGNEHSGYTAICKNCIDSVVFISEPICLNCGSPIDYLKDGRENIQNQTSCRHCNHASFSFSSAKSLFVYEPRIRKAIHDYKYSGNLSYARKFAKLIMASIFNGTVLSEKYDMIIPVPLHKKRYKKRGFNQAELLTHHLSKLTNISNEKSLLIRIKDTTPQSSLSCNERMKNTENAFLVINSKKVLNKKILLVDDIFTTGSTLEQCSKSLLSAGAAKVDVLTIAKIVSEDINNDYDLKV